MIYVNSILRPLIIIKNAIFMEVKVERSLIKDVLSDEYIGKPVTVCGWVRTRRESKGFAFLALSDGSSQETLQLIISAQTPAYQALHRCNTGAAIMVKGIMKESPAKGQRYEMEVSNIEVFGEADPEKYPLQKKGHTLEFLR